MVLKAILTYEPEAGYGVPSPAVKTRGPIATSNSSRFRIQSSLGKGSEGKRKIGEAN
jgi:hypothetical protein